MCPITGVTYSDSCLGEAHFVTDLMFLRNEFSKEEQGAKGWVEGYTFSLQKLQAADEVQCR